MYETTEMIMKGSEEWKAIAFQIQIEGWVALSLLFISAFVFVFVFVILCKVMKESTSNEDTKAAGCMVIIGLFIIMLAFFYLMLPDTIGKIINTDHYVLQYLTKG